MRHLYVLCSAVSHQISMIKQDLMYFETDVNLYAMHAKRVWIQKKDIESWKRSLGPFGEAFPPVSD